MMYLNKENVLVVIFNYNCNENANKLLKLFSSDFETVVLDSGSPIKDENFVLLDNIYYNGLFNYAVELLFKSNKQKLLIITSDVEFINDSYQKMVNKLSFLDETIGLYSASITKESQGHKFAVCKGTNSLRHVLFTEGFFSLIDKTILERTYPINTTINRLGWCTDLLVGFNCQESGLKCVIDDSICIHHPKGTGYDTDKANIEMYQYIQYINNKKFNEFIPKAFNQK